MKKKLTLTIFYFGLMFPLLAEPPSTLYLMGKIDTIMRQAKDISAKISLTQFKVNQGAKQFESLFFRRDRNDQFLMITISPSSDKGNGYLRSKDNFWMYRKNTRTFQHISRDENIMGTDIKGGDFEKRKLLELYKPLASGKADVLPQETMLGKKQTYKFTIVAKVNDVTYPKQVYWVERKTFLPLKIQSYSLSGTLMQTVYYPKYTQIDGNYIVIQAIALDEFEKGNKTIMELSSISLKPISDDVFTKGYLENLSK